METGFARKHLWCALAGTALAGGAVPALAQDTTPVATEAAAEEPGDIIVSARRRDETLQQTPVAITAIPAQALESKATINIGDLQGAAPNVLITNQNSGAAAANVSIRGLTFADVEKSFDPTVAVVVDGVFIGTSTGQFFDFFDIQQIEILRGPQGTLFGRNTIGGVINITRTRPTLEWGGKFEASYGRFDTLATRAVVNVPLVEGTLGLKGFYFHNESDGYYRHGITGKRVGSSNNENFGVALRLEKGGFDANLTLEKQVQRFDPVNSNIAKTGELFCNFEPANECNRNTTTDLYTVFNDPAVSRYSSPAATLEMNLDLGAVKLTSVTGYRESDEFQTQDFDASSSDLYFTTRTQDFRQFSQELRASGDITDALDYVVGVYYYDHKYSLDQVTRLFGGPAPEQIITGTSKSFAVFGDFNWELTDKFRAFFGGRWTKDRKTNFNNVGGVQFPLVKKTFDKFTPRVGVDYRPNDDILVYASWSRGYRSGGFSGRGQTLISSTTPFGPETVDSYEVGFKTAWLDRRLLFNVAAFYADYSDLQQNTTIPVPPPSVGNETIVTNVGSATIKGLEVDLTARPFAGFTLTGALGLLDSKFKGFITQAPDAAGNLLTFDYSRNHLIYNPNVTASVTADYEVPTAFGALLFNVGYRFIDNYDQQISLGPTTVGSNGIIIVGGNDPRVRSDKQGLLDASATARFNIGGARAKLTVFGRNLADDRGPNAAFTVAGLWSFASAREPRTYGVTLGFEF